MYLINVLLKIKPFKLKYFKNIAQYFMYTYM